MSAPPGVEVVAARPADLPAALALLARSGLPLDGLPAHWSTARVAVAAGSLVGCAALEIYPSGALLRSVAVEAEWRGRGLGRKLVAAALELAARRGMADVFLLTEGAADYFRALGFEEVARSAVPADVGSSVEFTHACPVSARAMRLRLPARLSPSP